MTEPKLYTVQCSWEMVGYHEVLAGGIEEAAHEAENMELPENASYVEDSFTVDYEGTVDWNEKEVNDNE